MREILFRGQATNRELDLPYRTKYKNGDWVYGLLTCVENYNGFSEMTNTDGIVGIKVDKNTVGQFTGFYDKNAKKIFEGDIFHFEDDIFAVVVFRNGGFELEEYGLRGTWTESGYDECGGGYGIIDCSPIDWYTMFNLEVIGNIYDNPELIPH